MNKYMTKSEIEKLFEKALKVSENAHAPYSNFHVGAAVIGNNGKIYVGCNVENGSYGLTMCAERNAIFAAIADGCKNIKAVMIVAPTGHRTGPCGACRSVIDEFADGDIPVMFGESMEELVYSSSKKLYNNKW